MRKRNYLGEAMDYKKEIMRSCEFGTIKETKKHLSDLEALAKKAYDTRSSDVSFIHESGSLS